MEGREMEAMEHAAVTRKCGIQFQKTEEPAKLPSLNEIQIQLAQNQDRKSVV